VCGGGGWRCESNTGRTMFGVVWCGDGVVLMMFGG